MRKRSKYKPKKVLLNPMGFVLEGMTPARAHSKIMLDLRIRHHAAMTSLTKGTATHHDIDTLIASMNMTEAFYRLGVGREYNNEIRDALNAIRELQARGADSGRFILRAAEMQAINEALAIHDAQLEVVTIKDMENAINIVNKELQQLREAIKKEKRNEC